jgi:glycosyltransferase involved in cell wall biosynthesis
MSDGPRLKVLTLTDQLVASGGAERVAMQIATGLDRDRFESVYCASRYAPGDDDPMVLAAERRMEAAGIRYFGLDRGSAINLASWRPLRRLLREERFDVIHAHMFGSNVWGTLVGRAARVPVVVAHEHTWSFQGKPLRRFVDREMIGRFSDVFVAVSREDERKMIEIEGVDRAKVLFVPNGIPMPPPPSGADVRAGLGIPPEAPVIGTVSVLRPQKALDVLIRACAPLLADEPELRILIAGSGPEHEQLADLISDLGVGDRVLLLGYRSDVPDILAALDVAISSSSFEGSPLAMMEFMEAALPIVATRVGGVPDLIDDGVHGLLVEAGDVEGMTQAIRRMLADRDAARAMGERGRERRRAEFDVDLMVRRFEALYERLRNGGGVPADVTQLGDLVAA